MRAFMHIFLTCVFVHVCACVCVCVSVFVASPMLYAGLQTPAQELVAKAVQGYASVDFDPVDANRCESDTSMYLHEVRSRF